MGTGGDRSGIHTRLATGLQVLDQLGQSADRLAQHVKNRRRSGQRVVEQPIQQIFDGPGKLAEITRADHASTALQGVERAADRHQRIALERILVPGREEFLDLRELFVRFFDEELHELRIGVLGQRSDFLRT
jgi:hypothetical protein